MRVCIEVVSCEDRPPAEALRAEFAAPGGSIGRGEHNDLVLPDPDRMISRTHAEVRILDHGEIELHDLGRATAVFVNGEAIGHGLSRRVDGSELLAIGHYVLRLSLLADPAAHRSPSLGLVTPDPDPDPDSDPDPDASIVLPQAELLALAERYGIASPLLPATAPPGASAAGLHHDHDASADPVPLPDAQLPAERAVRTPIEAVPATPAPMPGNAPVEGSDSHEQALLAEALAAMSRYFAARGSVALDGRVGIAVAAALRGFAPDQLLRQLLDQVSAADAAALMAQDARLWKLYCTHYDRIAEQAMQQAIHTLQDRPGN